MLTVVEIEGMMCEHCASKVKDALSNLENIKKVDVNYKLGLAKIESKNKIDKKVIEETINNLGFKFIKID